MHGGKWCELKLHLKQPNLRLSILPLSIFLNTPLAILTYVRKEARVTTKLRPQFYKYTKILTHLHVFWGEMCVQHQPPSLVMADGLFCVRWSDRNKGKNRYWDWHSWMRRQIKGFRKKQKWSYVIRQVSFLLLHLHCLLTRDQWCGKGTCFTYRQFPLSTETKNSNQSHL